MINFRKEFEKVSPHSLRSDNGMWRQGGNGKYFSTQVEDCFKHFKLGFDLATRLSMCDKKDSIEQEEEQEELHFDLEAAKHGDPIMQRDGREAVFSSVDPSGKSIVVWVKSFDNSGWISCCRNIDGSVHYSNGPCDNDIVMAPCAEIDFSTLAPKTPLFFPDGTEAVFIGMTLNDLVCVQFVEGKQNIINTVKSNLSLRPKGRKVVKWCAVVDLPPLFASEVEARTIISDRLKIARIEWEE